MKILKAYKVVKNSTDGTFQIGEIIWKSHNGDINSLQERGWIEPSEVGKTTLDYEVIQANGSEICKPIK